MADNSSNILKQLQEHQVPPPADAFEKAWEKILLQNEATGKSSEPEKKSFELLQDYLMQPPPVDLSAVMAGKKSVIRSRPVVFISKKIMKVAAVLALAVTGLAIYTAVGKKENEQPGFQPHEKLLTAGKMTDADTVTTTTAISQNTVDKASSSVNTANRNIAAAGLFKKRANISFGNSASYYNNDIFFTLVNYKEYGKEKLFTQALRNKKVTLNQYSYVNLSDKMVAMLQEVYLTKKNGKPSRKAKKAKKKFEKWRKKDEKYFDAELNKSPVDIIDLGEFLMEN